MPERSKRVLLQMIEESVEAVGHLRATLLQYEKANRRLYEEIAQGTPVLEALDLVSAPALRPELTDSLDRFSGARHRVRVGITELALKQGASISDIGRALSISRQLAHRIASEISSKEETG